MHEVVLGLLDVLPGWLLVVDRARLRSLEDILLPRREVREDFGSEVEVLRDHRLWRVCLWMLVLRDVRQDCI